VHQNEHEEEGKSSVHKILTIQPVFFSSVNRIITPLRIPLDVALIPCIRLPHDLLKPSFSLFLALRYLKPKRTFVSTITLISVLGVTLGITVLIVVISVMTGFDHELRRKVLGFDPHLVLHNSTFLEKWRPMEQTLATAPGVVAAAPFVQGPVLVEHQGRRLTPQMRGIDPEKEIRVSDIRGTIRFGQFDLDGDKALIGSALAQELEVTVGDTITVFSPGNINQIVDEIHKAELEPGNKKTLNDLRSLVLPQQLTVSGIFETGRFVFDSEYVLVPLYIGQELYGLRDGIHGIGIRSQDPNHPEILRDQLRPLLGPHSNTLQPLQLRTWIELNQQIFDAIHMERNVMFFLLLFIVIVAAFGVMNTLITVTVQKTREIGVLKALGATRGQIVRVFLAQGMVVGLFGNLAGLAAGMSVIRWRNEFRDFLSATLRFDPFPASIYQFSSIPAEIVPRDVAVVCISAFFICSAAALFPAYAAARLDPVKALRSE
jgi:lipoprotein-releasing system permease protein